MALPPPDCIWRMKKIQTPISSSIGNQDISTPQNVGVPSSIGCAVMRTLCFCNLSDQAGIVGGEGGDRPPVLKHAGDLPPLDRHLADVAAIDLRR